MKLTNFLHLFYVFYGLLPYAISREQKSHCASLFNGATQEFQLGDFSSYGNLESEHTGTETTWNITKSWKISEGCALTVCNGSYFTGTCEKFNQSIPALTNEWLKLKVDSVNCSCSKECSCREIKMKYTSCARAYLTNSCNVCNPTYTELKGDRESFLFDDPVKSLVIKNGCSLTVYEEENFDGDFFVYNQTVEEYGDSGIGSFECKCDPDAFVPEQQTQLKSNSSNMVDIPNNLEDIFELMEGPLEKHPALLGALQSIKHKRSPKNAYILLLGITGSGKSTAINLLFDNPNVTSTGGYKSTTDAIHEFRIPIQSEELGIGNGELRVIDTPGLGDTGGLNADARFLATLDDFFSNHDELKNPNVIPNIVLIFHKFNDNRFAGVGSNYVKVLRGLDAFRTRITDRHYSNVIFVFSHFASDSTKNRQNPKTKLKAFKRTIENYSQFPKPITMVVAENKPEAQELPIVNGYIKLMNGEYYPKNLFDKIQTVTIGGGDPIGEAMFSSAFYDATKFNFSRSSISLVGSDNAKVTKYLHALKSASTAIEDSHISKLIENAYEKMPNELRSRFPTSKKYLQTAMYLRNINNLEDIPKTTPELVLLLRSLEFNEGTSYILEHGLGMKAPTIKQNSIVGYFYAVLNNLPKPTTPFNLGTLQSSKIGFTFPSTYTCSVTEQRITIFKMFESKKSYLDDHLRSLNINDSVNLKDFKGRIPAGFNVKNASENVTTITAIHEFRNFKLHLKSDLELKSDFVKSLKSLEPFNEISLENVEQWKKFFNDWGTHIVKSVYGGGAIEIHLTSATQFKSNSTNINSSDILDKLVGFVEDVTKGKIFQNVLLSQNDVKIGLKFHGGDQAYHIADLAKLKLSEIRNLIKNWIESLNYDPAILSSEFEILPISEFVKNFAQNVSTEIEKATKLLLTSKLAYNNAARLEAEIAERTRLMLIKQEEELANARKAAAEERERIEQERAEFERQRIEREKKQAEEERQRQIQAEKDRKEYERKKAAQEAELRRQQAALQEQRRLEARQRELERQLEIERQQRRRRRRKGCLKKGTGILALNGSEIPVENIKIGDIILDHELKPTRVISTLKKFLMEDRFLGFDELNDNNYFFTTTHIIGGPKYTKVTSDEQEEGGIQFYVQNISKLYDENPLLENNLDVFQFNEDFKTNVLTLNEDMTVEGKQLKLISDPKKYPKDTFVYILGVDSKSGTYIANGIVCRHEMPPLELWSNTIETLLKILQDPQINEVTSTIEYTVENRNKIENIVHQLNRKLENIVKRFLNNEELIQEADEYTLDVAVSEDLLNQEETLMKVFNDASFSVLGMEMYASTGKLLSPILEDSIIQQKFANYNQFQRHLIYFSSKFLRSALKSV